MIFKQPKNVIEIIFYNRNYYNLERKRNKDLNICRVLFPDTKNTDTY